MERLFAVGDVKGGDGEDHGYEKGRGLSCFVEGFVAAEHSVPEEGVDVVAVVVKEEFCFGEGKDALRDEVRSVDVCGIDADEL
jgi:hypothetical protein